ncbi:MAG: sigma-70 family RNA polymerase sigma factor [Clostridium butyricum]|nr:sigma-70 family RNA polymerase sigma factor [Clostridium butyricum]
MGIKEENFILHLKKRNEKALDYVIDNYGGLIKSVVKKHLYNLQSHQDECINDVLLAIWNNIDSFDEERSTFKNWIIGISRFKSIDYQRKYLKHLEYEDIDNVNLVKDDFSEELIRDELSDEVNKMMECLKEKDRQIFYRLYIEEKEIEEISSDMGIRKDAVYNRVSRAKKKLKDSFITQFIGGTKYEK